MVFNGNFDDRYDVNDLHFWHSSPCLSQDLELSIKDAAEILGKSPRAVRYMIQSGRVKAAHRGKMWFIRKNDLPLTEAQRQVAEQRASRFREAVDQAIGVGSAQALPSESWHWSDLLSS